jgi:4-O-beta-D-mannosyl-D-glucose phosphorylase
MECATPLQGFAMSPTLLLTDLEDPGRVLRRPGGYFIAPEEEERTGDVSNVVFSNGWVMRPDGAIFIYYGSSDTRMKGELKTEENERAGF